MMFLLPAVASGTPTLNQIHHTDALTLLKALPAGSVDMLLLDPPYAVHEAEWDKPFDIAAHFKEWRRVIKDRRAIVITCVMRLAWQLIADCPDWFKYDLVMVKNYPTEFWNAKVKPMRRHENILVFSNGTTANGSSNPMVYFPQMGKGRGYKKKDIAGNKGKVWGTKGRKCIQVDYLKEYTTERYPDTILHAQIQNHKNLHPNQKDAELYEYLIQTYTRPGELVLDPFSGSGTTAIAARKTGRNFVCCDSSREYVEMSRKRLATTDPYQSKEVAPGLIQKSMFAGMSV